MAKHSFTFSSKHLTDSEIRQFGEWYKACEIKSPTISQKAQRAADDKIHEAAEQLQAEAHKAGKAPLPLRQAIFKALEQNPMLARLSRAGVTLPRVADITVDDDE